MTMNKNRMVLTIIIIVAIVVLIAVVGISLFDMGHIIGESGPPSGTWSVEESFEGSPTSDFAIEVRNLRDATHFQVFVEDVPIGERVSIDHYVRSVSIIFTRPESIEVWFFSGEDAGEPFIKARCHESGELIFPDTELDEEENLDGDIENDS